MSRISQADQFVLLLRERLAQRARAKGARTERSSEASPESVTAVLGQSAHAGADDDQLRRSILEQLLTERLGSELVNDAGFQQVVNEVDRILTSDPALADQFTFIMSELRRKGV